MRENNHPKHKVRNFFYIPLCLLFALGFCLFFLGIFKPYAEPWVTGLCIVIGALVILLGLYVGIVRPLQKQIRYQQRQKRH